MNSIKKRLAVNFLFIIVITVITLEVLIIHIVRQNYYENLESSLYNQVRLSADLYLRYFADSTLSDNVLNNVDTFWKQTSAQVQIIDKSGRVLMDSIGAIPSSDEKSEDIEEALKGNKGVWVGKVDYDDEKVMAVSYPLKSRDRIVGALRYVSSLRAVNEELGRITRIFILIGVMVALISAIISLLLAGSIINPLKEVTTVAEKMARGIFNIQCRKRNDDEIGKLSDTLNYMAREILTKDRLKNDFISSVSHELRTPLTSIKGWAVTLKGVGPEDRELMQDGLEIIEKESDRLTSMVEELLDFSRFVSGKVEIKKERVYIPELLQHIKMHMLPRAERDSIRLEVECDPELPYVITDENRLKQVFINILDNSFRFTPSGGSILFTAERKDGHLNFYIKDTGCGIPPEELSRVKEKFFKGKDSKSGNGIGLSICDEIIKLMNGSFEIKSQLNKGTETFISLPICEG